MPLATSSRATISGLVVLCTALTTVIAVEIWYPPRLLELQSVRRTDPILESDTGGAAVEYFKNEPIARYSNIVERPLFLEKRQPPEPDAPAPVVRVEPEEDKSFTLIGVLVMPEATTALVQVDETGKVVRLKSGEKIGDWRLESVNANRVTLRKGGKAKTLPLIRNRKQLVEASSDPAEQRRQALERRRLQIIEARKRATFGQQIQTPNMVEGETADNPDITNQEVINVPNAAAAGTVK